MFAWSHVWLRRYEFIPAYTTVAVVTCVYRPCNLGWPACTVLARPQHIDSLVMLVAISQLVISNDFFVGCPTLKS